MKRLFFGLASDCLIRQQCTNIMSSIDNRENQLVAAVNLHVTLLFLGGVDTEKETVLVEEAATIPCPKMAITFDRLSYWQKPGILCLTTSRVGSELLSLVDRLAAVAEKRAIAVDARPYQPHVTLARKAKQPVELAVEPVIWQADSFCLFESCPSGHSVEYRMLNCWGRADAG